MRVQRVVVFCCLLISCMVSYGDNTPSWNGKYNVAVPNPSEECIYADTNNLDFTATPNGRSAKGDITISLSVTDDIGPKATVIFDKCANRFNPLSYDCKFTFNVNKENELVITRQSNNGYDCSYSWQSINTDPTKFILDVIK